MATILSVDDLVNGMFVTVHSWKNKQDNSYKGDILLIKEICLPYILVQDKRGIFHLDIREVEFQKLSEKYIELLLNSTIKQNTEEYKDIWNFTNYKTS